MADYQSIHSGNTIDTRVSQVATNTADIAALKSRVDGTEAKIPSSATSSNKLADRAYVDNAIAGKASASSVSAIEAKIPSDATSSNQLADKAFVNNGLSGKVNAVAGKGLSTNDYTTSDKSKLDSLPTASELESDLAGKQATLVGSGTGQNIKTINNQNILGSGNITIEVELVDNEETDDATKGHTAAGGKRLKDGIRQLETKVITRLPEVSEGGFFVADQNGNVGMKYDEQGFDVALLSPNFLGKLSLVRVNEVGVFFVDEELRIGAQISKGGLRAKSTINYVIE